MLGGQAWRRGSLHLRTIKTRPAKTISLGNHFHMEGDAIDSSRRTSRLRKVVVRVFQILHRRELYPIPSEIPLDFDLAMCMTAKSNTNGP